jgi:hypothetical protein
MMIHFQPRDAPEGGTHSRGTPDATCGERRAGVDRTGGVDAELWGTMVGPLKFGEGISFTAGFDVQPARISETMSGSAMRAILGLIPAAQNLRSIRRSTPSVRLASGRAQKRRPTGSIGMLAAIPARGRAKSGLVISILPAHPVQTRSVEDRAMSEGAAKFSCTGCNRSYTWKTELAGRRVKCKCGQVMTVPHAPPSPQQQEDELYDMAPTGDDAQSAFSRMRSSTSSAAAPVGQPAAPAGVPLAYQQGPTQRERERMSATSSTIMDIKRDVHVPVALLVAGFALCVGYYAVRSGSGAAIAGAGIGIALMTLIKATLMIGFAFVIAGPLGVSFGGVWTAALKLAAIAVFADGVATWIDAGVAKVSGGAGGIFAGAMSFPIVLGVYWVLLIYLFSMDSGDSWMVVMLLAVFDMIIRTALILLLLRFFLSFAGAPVAALPVPAFGGGGGSAAASSDPMVQHVQDLKDSKSLQEAKEYIAGGRQMALSKPTEAWYGAGCKNVWFEVSRDINGLMTPESLIVELPKDKEKRKKCYEILREYYTDQHIDFDEDEVKDDGDTYLVVGVSG